MKDSDIKLIASCFGLDDINGISEISSGHINATYRVDTAEESFLLQRINTSVFTDPYAVMENIARVLERIPVLRLIRTAEGGLCYSCSNGVWRMYNFIGDSISYERIVSADMAGRMGRALRSFHTVLSGLDASALCETIPRFHDMDYRFSQLEDAIREDRAGRLSSVRDEVCFMMSGRERASRLSHMYADGLLPRRVTHNDTKLSNVLFDRRTGEYITFIDLDTVMPGTLLFDTGDMIRTGCSTAAEDEEDLDKVHFSEEFFEAMRDGYIEGNDMLTPMEKDLFAESGRTITFIMALRFLTDYINGDVYYRTEYAHHNLVRARNQIHLIMEMDDYLGGQS